MKKIKCICLSMLVATPFLSGCFSSGNGQGTGTGKHWTHYAQKLPGEIEGETNGVREFWADDNGHYQFNEPSTGTVEYSSDVDFSTFSSKDPRYIIPITEGENEFKSVLVDIGDNYKLYKDEISLISNYVIANNFTITAGSTKKLLFKHRTSPNVNSYYCVNGIGCTSVFTCWDEMKTTFGGSIAYSPQFKDLDSNVFVEGYYAITNDFDITDDVAYSGIDCLLETDLKIDRGFRGTFDGRGHTLTEKGKSYSGGLFGSILGGTIKNLTLSEIKLDSDQLGALSCQSHNGRIENVNLNFSSIKGTNSGAGIIVGKHLRNTTFKNVKVNAEELSVKSVFGGFYYSNNVENFVINVGTLENWGASDDGATTIAKPDGAIANISASKIVLDLPIQDLYLMSSSVQSISLGDEHSSITTCDDVSLYINETRRSLGNNVKSIVIPENLKTTSVYGNGTVEVKVGATTYVVDVFIATKSIETLQDLESLAAYDTNQSSVDGYYVINSNKEFSAFSKVTSRTWNFEKGFEGILDGRNHKIKLDLSGAKNGLFGVMRNATVKNLTIETTSYSGGSDCLLAYYMADSTFTNLSVIINNSVVSINEKAKFVISNGGSLRNTFNNFSFVASCDIDSLFSNYYELDDYSNATITVPSLRMFADNTGSISRHEVPSGCALMLTKVYEDAILVEKSSSTFTIPVTVDGSIMGIYYNSTNLGTSKTISTSSLSGESGEVGDITILYSKNNIVYRSVSPVIVVTKIIKTVNDIKNYLTIADQEVGTTGDGYYGGYFIFGNDITWDESYYDKNMSEIPHNVNQVGKGFNGVIDGRGHLIYNFKTNCADQHCGLVPRLGKDGVVKNLGFVDVAYTNCSIISAWGEGLVENVYVSYKNGYVHSATSAVINVFSTSYANILMKDSLVDARNDTATSRRALGNGHKSTKLSYNNVYVLTKSSDTPVVEYDGSHPETGHYFNSTDGRPYPVSYDTFSSYTNYADLLLYGGDEINTWNFFSYSNNTLKFGDKVLTTSSKSSLPTNHRFLEDYTIVYDKNSIDSIKAAYLIELEYYKGSADSLTYQEVNAQDYSLANVTNGKHIRKVAYTNYSSNSNLIVVGNDKVAEEAGVSFENNRIVKKDNSIFVMSKNKYDMMAAGYEFLKEVLGCSILGQDYIIFNNIPSVAPEIDMEFTVAAPYRLLTNKITDYFYEQMGINLAYSGYLFDDGPYQDGDPSKQKELIHNDLDWFPANKFKSAHPKWYRSWNNLDVCWTAHGDEKEYQALVDTFANEMYEILSNNPDAVRLSFGMEDINYTHCECEACCKVEQEHGSYAYQGIKLLNDVTSKVENMPGMSGREFYVYLLGYYFCAKAPTGIDIGEHVGLTYAPIRYDYGKPTSSSKSDGSNPIKPEQAKIIHDESSVGNKFVKDNFIAWLNLFAKKNSGKNEMGCWLYNTYFNNYMSFMDTYEANISVCEMIAHEGKGNLRFVFIQGQGKVANGTGFEAFKQFVNSRALIEAGDKVKDYKDCANYEEYRNSVSDYLMELENEFFGIGSRISKKRFTPSGNSYTYSDNIAPYRTDCNFINKGFYGYSKANSSMYTMYLVQRLEYAKALKDGKIIANVGERLQLSTSSSTTFSSFSTSVLDFNNYLVNGSGTKKTYYKYSQFTIGGIKTMLTCYFEGLKNIEEFNGVLKNLCERHINYEGLCPLFFATMCNSTNASHGFGSGYTYDGTSTTYSYKDLKDKFKSICTSYGLASVCEGASMATFYSKFGY